MSASRQTDERLNSFVTLLADESRSAAADAESAIQGGGYLGPLHGIPIGLKDLYYTKGIRTTVGSKIMGDFIPDYDAAVTERFRDAGAILLGKLQMHEFALGATSENPHHGPARNPWDTTRITGGSSGGFRRCSRFRTVHGGTRQRYRRLSAYPVVRLRHRRAEAHLRQSQQTRRIPTV